MQKFNGSDERDSGMKHCTELIAGGGMYGCGFAAACPGCLFAEDSFVPGWDFILSLAPVSKWMELQHPEAAAFRQEFFRRKGVDRTGYFRNAALYPELAAWLSERNIDVRLGTSVLLHEGTNVCFLISSSGIQQISFDRFYDFRPNWNNGKKFHALIRFADGNPKIGKFSGFELENSSVPGCSTLTLAFDSSVTMTQARAQLRKVWAERPAGLADGKIAWSAEVFDPALFPDPFTALDAGLRKETLK